MTSRDGRGGRRVPDGQARPPSNIPFAQGRNRTDLSALPGTPGTRLPEGPGTDIGTGGGVEHGAAGPARRALSGIPLDSFSTQGGLGGPSGMPDQPITAGADMGDGPGSEALIPQQDELSNMMAAQEMRAAYPMIARLATMPNATTQTKILAQRLRTQMPFKPEQVPPIQPGFPEPEASQEAPGGVE